MSRDDDISTRGRENANRIPLDQVTILAAELQVSESMAQAYEPKCTPGRDKNVAMRQPEESPTHLQTDHLDIWHIHAVMCENDRDLILAPNRAAVARLEAQRRSLPAGYNCTLLQPK